MSEFVLHAVKPGTRWYCASESETWETWGQKHGETWGQTGSFLIILLETVAEFESKSSDVGKTFRLSPVFRHLEESRRRSVFLRAPRTRSKTNTFARVAWQDALVGGFMKKTSQRKMHKTTS
jgi:hypothetical protein